MNFNSLWSLIAIRCSLVLISSQLMFAPSSSAQNSAAQSGLINPDDPVASPPVVSYVLRRPFEVANQFPLALFHTFPAPSSATLVSPGAGLLDINLIVSNTFTNRPRRFTNDAETTNLSLNYSYGLASRWEINTQLGIIDESGGVFDHLIDQWHQFFGLPRGGRNQTEEDNILLSALDAQGNSLRLDDSEVGLSNLRVSLKHSLLTAESNDAFDLSLSGFSTIPTATTRRFGAPRPDLGLQILSEVPLEKLSLHSGGGLSVLGDTSTKGYEFETIQFSGFLGSSYALTRELVAIATISAYSKLLKNIPGFPDHSIYLDLGARYHLAESWYLSSFIRENPSHRKGTTDISAIVGLSRVF